MKILVFIFHKKYFPVCISSSIENIWSLVDNTISRHKDIPVVFFCFIFKNAVTPVSFRWGGGGGGEAQ